MGTPIVVDCEAPFGVGAPSVGDMTEFGAVDVNALQDGRVETFHGTDCSEDTFRQFREWLTPRMPVVFVSDNPAYDFQWINFYFWRYFGANPFGHSGRRIADFYAGLVGDFRSTQKWKRLRRTKHDHHPVHDALGNAEALIRLLDGERRSPPPADRERVTRGDAARCSRRPPTPALFQDRRTRAGPAREPRLCMLDFRSTVASS